MRGRYQPQWFDYLPFDDIDALRDEIGFLGTGSLEEQLAKSSEPDPLFEDAVNLVSALIGALIVMVPIRWVYMNEGLAKSQSAEVATGLLAPRRHSKDRKRKKCRQHQPDAERAHAGCQAHSDTGESEKSIRLSL